MGDTTVVSTTETRVNSFGIFTTYTHNLTRAANVLGAFR